MEGGKNIENPFTWTSPHINLDLLDGDAIGT